MEDLPKSYRAEVVDGYGMKLLTSGYSLEVTRKILWNGIKGYQAKVKRRKSQGMGRIHRTAEESSKDRVRRKLLGKSTWYKGKKKDDREQLETGGNGGQGKHQGAKPKGGEQ